MVLELSMYKISMIHTFVFKSVIHYVRMMDANVST